MMKAKRCLSLFLLPLFLLSGCQETNSSTSGNVSGGQKFSIICPKGAPAAAFARYGKDDFLELASAQQVRSAFTTAEKDFIVFDSVNGLKLSGGNYRLVRMVTFGNLYVVSTGHDEDSILEDEDTIFSYGEGLVPDLAFKAVHEGVTPDHYGSDVSATSAVMTSGLFEGKEIDYVISSYPPIFPAMKVNPSLTVHENVAVAFGEKYHTDGFPQAGLFIRNTLEEDAQSAEAISAFLEAFDQDVDDLIKGGENAVSTLEAYGSIEEQADRFGFNADVLSAIQKDNGLAFLESEKNPSLEEFGIFQDMFDYPVSEKLLSSFYPKG